MATPHSMIRLLGNGSGDPETGWLERRIAALPIEERQRCATEIGELLERDLCENQLRDLLSYEIGCEYVPETEGLDSSGWLRQVRRRLLESVQPGDAGASSGRIRSGHSDQ